MANPKGYDVSHWQPRTPDLTGQSFLFARASIAASPDLRYKQHIAAAKKAGLVTGAYHFGYKTISMETQAKVFVDAAGDVDLYVLDVEGANAPSHANSRKFMDLVRKATGKPVGLYASDSPYFEAGQDFNWVANYSRKPRHRWDFWQYTSFQGGIHLDRNVYNGTLAELKKLAGNITLPDTGTEDIVGPAWEPTGASIGTFTITKEGANLIATADGAFVPEPVGYVRNVYRKVVINDGKYKDKDAYLTSLGLESYLILASLGRFDPADVPTGPDNTPYSQTDVDNARKAGKLEGIVSEQKRISVVLGI